MTGDFKKLMSARFLFTLGTQIQSIVLGWQMYVLTKDPLFLGLIGLVEAVPALGLAMHAGFIVDRSRPLPVYRRVLAMSLVSGLVLLVAQLPGISLEKRGLIAALFLSSFLTGAARAFAQPAMFALVPRLLPRAELPRASAWMTSAMQIARISGPALGGVLYGWIGVSGSAGAVCVCLVAAVAAAFLVKASPAALPPSGAHGSRRAELLSGAAFVLRHPVLLPALSLDMISVLFGGVTALLPVFAAEVLMTGPTGLGALRAAPAIGAAITSIWLVARIPRAKAGGWLFGSVAGFGACTLVFALSRDFLLSICALGLSGAFDSVSMVIRTSAVQLSSPDSMRGKISAVNSIFIGSSNEIGEFESGVAARLFGTVPAAVIGGVICLVTVGVVAVLSPRLRKLDLNELAAAHRP